MAHRDPSSPTPLPAILRYGIAVLSVAIATGLGLFLLRYLLVEIRLTPFLFAVAVTVWYGGIGPGVLAIVLAVLSLNYFIVPPFGSFNPISKADLVYLTCCTLCALAVGWVSAVRRRAEQVLRRARDELDAKVVERTANLQRSEGYLAEAQRLSHTGSWVLNVAARETIHWSQETYRLYGFDPDGGIPPFEALLQRIHPEDRDRFVDDLERAIRERADHEMIFRAVLPGGTLKYILGIGHPVFNASGDVVEFVGAAMDITERKRAEVVGQRLAAIVDSSEDAIVSKDLNGTIESWNGGAERLFGYQASEVIGKSILIIIPPDRHEEELGILERIRCGERIKPFETVRMRQDGSLLDISLTVSPLRDAAGRIIGASKIARDITERKLAEARERALMAELTFMNRAATAGELSASLAHELKQPLTAIVTRAGAARHWLAAETLNIDKARAALDKIETAGHRAGDIIKNVSAVFKKDTHERNPVDVNRIILEVMSLGEIEFKNHRIEVHTKLDDRLPRVIGNRVQLQQVILNVVMNAVEAMHSAQPRRLHIQSGLSKPDVVHVSIADTGIGIDPANADAIFKPLYTTKEHGMGMGLSICRSIIEDHGGRIWASPGEPRGAIFQFELPTGI